MFCKNCGQTIDDNADFCIHCGTAVNRSQQGNNQTNTVALVGFVLSFFITISGLICSIIGLIKSNEYGGNGKGLAIAGIVISAVSMIIGIIIGVVVYTTVIKDIINNLDQLKIMF